MVELSEGIIPLSVQPGDEHGGSGNPHVWLDPANVMRWVENAALALGRIDPDHQEIFTANARVYELELASLQDWIEAQIAALPAERRLLVTDHRELEYFAQRYGFEIAGTLVASFSSDAEPSARELADLETQLLELDARSSSAPPSTRSWLNGSRPIQA
jgi:ABC-type Zn uptake system ZnuABC Zn-binding protein ZnuA